MVPVVGWMGVCDHVLQGAGYCQWGRRYNTTWWHHIHVGEQTCDKASPVTTLKSRLLWLNQPACFRARGALRAHTQGGVARSMCEVPSQETSQASCTGVSRACLHKEQACLTHHFFASWSGCAVWASHIAICAQTVLVVLLLCFS